MTRQTTNQTHQQKPTATPSASGLLQRKCACGNHTMAGNECAECGKTKRFGLQTKLKVNEPGDIYEREADRIADQVMATPADPTVSGAPPRIQRFAGQATGQADTAPASVDRVLASPGHRLDPALQQDMGQRFGHDFSRVQVHSGAAAEQSAREVNANAYTVGHNIVFGAGRFAPGTHEGRRLIAHELTHVVQQSGADGSRVDQSDDKRGLPPVSLGQPQLFRQAAIEPHYPTEEEQREIEKILSREVKPTKATPDKPAEKKHLNDDEIRDYVERLKPPFLAELSKLDTGPSASSGDVLKEADAFRVVTRAREAIYKHFGDYASRIVTLTQDETTTPDTRKAANQVLVNFGASPNDALSLAVTIIETKCEQCRDELSQLDDKSKKAVVNGLTTAGFQVEKGAKLRRVAQAVVGGSYAGGDARIRIALETEATVYHTAVHELIHALAHPAFHAAFINERHITEGFTEYFTRDVVSDTQNPYEDPFQKVSRVRKAMTGPFVFASIGGASADESMRLAYFRGRLELIGWRPSGPEEEKAVEEAGGSAKWDPGTARQHAPIYQAQAQAKQGASRNVLGVGFYFTKGSDDKTIAVRYARVIARTEPYAKGQLLLEGKLLGSPVQNPARLGASLGIAAEYQEPYFYAGGGVRFVGTAAPAGGAAHLDVSPFAGFGIRAWQTVRVGAEGFVLLPLTGQDIQIGGGITLGIEFK